MCRIHQSNFTNHDSPNSPPPHTVVSVPRPPSSRSDARSVDDDDDARMRRHARRDGRVATIPHRRCARVRVSSNDERTRRGDETARTGATKCHQSFKCVARGRRARERRRAFARTNATMGRLSFARASSLARRDRWDARERDEDERDARGVWLECRRRAASFGRRMTD